MNWRRNPTIGAATFKKRDLWTAMSLRSPFSFLLFYLPRLNFRIWIQKLGAWLRSLNIMTNSQIILKPSNILLKSSKAVFAFVITDFERPIGWNFYSTFSKIHLTACHKYIWPCTDIAERKYDFVINKIWKMHTMNNAVSARACSISLHPCTL